VGNVFLKSVEGVANFIANEFIKPMFKKNIFTKLSALIVKDGSKYKTNHEKDLLNEMKVRLGNSIKFSIQYLNEIPVENSGKFRMVKNNMQNSDYN